MKTTNFNFTYVNVNKKLEFRVYEVFTAPTGWYRIDVLYDKIKNDNYFSHKFTIAERKTIKRIYYEELPCIIEYKKQNGIHI